MVIAHPTTTLKSYGEKKHLSLLSLRARKGDKIHYHKNKQRKIPKMKQRRTQI